MRHQHISFAKSIIRILGYSLLPINIVFATTALVLSELLGIIEEIGHE
jgi:hypothetical protein